MNETVFKSRGRLRTGWRLLLFFVCSFVPLILVTSWLKSELLVRYLVYFAILLGISLFFARFVDKRQPGTVGFMIYSGWLRHYLKGVGLGFLMVTSLFLVEYGLGHVRVEMNVLTPDILRGVFLFALLTTVVQTAFEELYFRGYLFQNLIEATNAFWATGFLSVLFGVGHLLTPHASWITASNLTIFGVMHAIGYLKTKSLWFSAGLHFSWNFVMRNVYGLPVSGTVSANSLLVVERNGPIWLTGGNYGPEAGIPAMLLMTVACFLIAFGLNLHPAPKVMAFRKRYEDMFI